MEHGRIRTTEARAKEARKIADRVITLSKRVPNASLDALTGDALQAAKVARVHAIRLAGRWVNSKDVLHTVFTVYSDRYATRPGGYTRIYKLSKRPGDQADMVLLELVTEECVPKAKKA
jgi:large subunit ribosomal protein L17